MEFIWPSFFLKKAMKFTASSEERLHATHPGLIISTGTPMRKTFVFFIHFGDLTDATNLIRIIQEVYPDEIYNLAAQSPVKVSCETPEYTANADGIGTLRLLEAIRVLKREATTRFYQPSTTEMCGKVPEIPQKETTPFYPRSPYGTVKVYGYWIMVNYRDAYNIFACNGILFNHESPIQGETFVTPKIIRAVARIKLGLQEDLYLGNLDPKRDCDYAGDYAEAMWLMLHQGEPDDYAVGTGKSHAVREVVEKAYKEVEIDITWERKGLNEVGKDYQTGKAGVLIDPRYFRLTEVDALLSDLPKAREKLGWRARVSFRELVKMMVTEDLRNAEKDQFCKNEGIGSSGIMINRRRKGVMIWPH
jgi:GDPmannose 4,6-dehydratase